MADETGLQVIGWTFGGITLAVMLIASLLVADAVANPSAAGGSAVTVTLEAR